MMEETSATVAGPNKLLPQADRLEDMLVEGSRRGHSAEETGFADLLAELHAISVSNAQVLHAGRAQPSPDRTAGAIVAHLTKATA